MEFGAVKRVIELQKISLEFNLTWGEGLGDRRYQGELYSAIRCLVQSGRGQYYRCHLQYTMWD